MKLSIYGDRLSFYQWDTGQRLIVDGADMCEEVHFVTRELNGALVVRIENQDGLRVANVPNLLLQSAYPITAYVYYRNADNRETRYARVFGVKSREKPSDYVYTETEVLTYKKLEEKLDQMQGLIGDLTDLKTESKDNLVDAINKTIYTLPPMTGTTLGGAMADPAQESDTQPVRIGADHKLYTAPGGGGSGGSGGSGGEYTLPIATAEKLGGVKPVTKTEDMTQSVGVDSEGRLFTAEALDDVLCVNLSRGEGGTITADKTFVEITGAAGSGMCVIARIPSGTTLYLSSYNDTSVRFLLYDGVQVVYAYCDGSNTWGVGTHILNASDVGAIPSPSTAAVGQTIVVKAVDGNGVPTEWGAADMPSGGGGIYGLLEQYDMFELAYGVLDSANLPARVVITEDSGGNAFDVDGIIVWTDIKSNVSYTSIAFNNRATVANPASHPYHYGLSHGIGTAFNLYLCGANNTFLQLLADGTLRLYKKQNKNVDGIDFYPAANIEDVPSSITAICLNSEHNISSGTFYKVWGLKKKNV